MTLSVSQYRAHRADGIPASVALTWARSAPALALDWNGAGDRAELERDGFAIVVRVEPDDIPPAEADFTDAAPADPMMERLCRNPRAWDVDGEPLYGSGHYRYVVPACTSYADERAALHARGYSRHDADAIARRSVRQLVELLVSDDYTSSVVVVTASRAGVELGSDALGGVDIDGRGSWQDARSRLESVISDHEMIDGAIADARSTLQNLCTGAA